MGQIFLNGQEYGAIPAEPDNEIEYESGDELNPSEPAEVPKLENRETLKSFAQKVSLISKNVRYLLKMLGSTDISEIGDGTLTGAAIELKRATELLAEVSNEHADDISTLDEEKANRTELTRVKGNAETEYRKGDVNLTPENIGALSTAGGRVDGVVQLLKTPLVRNYPGTAEAGYFVFARITIDGSYLGNPIEMKIISRGDFIPSVISIRFGDENNNDPGLSNFVKYISSERRFFIKKTKTSTWDLCTLKNGWVNITILSVSNNSDFSTVGAHISYPGEYITDFVASEWTEATLGGRIKEAENLMSLVSTMNESKAASNTNYIGYISDEKNLKPVYGASDGAMYRQYYSDVWRHQIYGDYRTGQIAVQGLNNGAWTVLRKVVDHLNFRNLIPEASTTQSGLMSAADKAKLNSITTSSSRRYKKNVIEMDEEEARKLLELFPVRYDYINEEDGTDCYGLIAEDVAEVIRYPVVYVDGEPDAIDYSKFVPYLIKMVQIQTREIEELKKAVGSVN